MAKISLERATFGPLLGGRRQAWNLKRGNSELTLSKKTRLKIIFKRVFLMCLAINAT